MKKKIVAMSLAFMLLCTTFFSHTAIVNAIGTEPTITVETVNAYRGDDDVTVNISISNNPGIVYMQLEIAYPSEKLELVSGTDTELLSGWLTPPNFESSNPAYVTWDDGLAETNNTNNGTILTLKFKVKNFDVTEFVKFGMADIVVSYDPEQVFDVNMDNVGFTVTNGGINITCNHDGETHLKDAKEASCFEKGYTGDTYCSICDEKIADGKDIPTSSHTPATDWSYSETHHWKDCTIVACGNKVSEEEHYGGNKTCTAQAICTACNQPYGDIAPHSYTVPQKDSDNHWNKCENCDAIDTKVAHTFDQQVKNSTTLKSAADCDEDAIYYYSCTCGQVSATLTFVDTGSATGNHTDADGKWETDGTKHWHTCKCGKILDEQDHNGGTATCVDQATCSICQVKYGTTNGNNHLGGTYLVGQKEPECYEKGYTGDTYCASCNVKIADGTDINESEHSPASVWTTNDTHHWKVCEVIACGNIVDKGEHIGGNKTCTAKAICAVCHIPYGDLLTYGMYGFIIMDSLN